MSNKLIKLGQSVKAFNLEVLDNGTEINKLRTVLQARWFQEPVVQGQNPKTLKLALPDLSRDNAILSSLVKFKSQKTDERGYSAKRGHKRFYLNPDSVLDESEVTTPRSTIAWAAKYRLTGLSRTNGLSIGNFDQDTLAKTLTSGMQMELIDYDYNGTYQTSSGYKDLITSVSKTNPSGNGLSSWANKTLNEYNELRFNESGRYLVTGRFNLRMFFRGESRYTFSDVFKVVTCYAPGYQYGTDFKYSYDSEKKLDGVFPRFRLKIIVLRPDPTLPDSYSFVDVFYSGYTALAPTGIANRGTSFGISAIMNVQKNDILLLSLERSHRAFVYNCTDVYNNCAEGICTAKIKGFSSGRPDRDQSNYLEITRLCGEVIDPSTL